jgi:hypothetical protein
MNTKPWTWTDSLDKRPRLKKMEMRLGTWTKTLIDASKEVGLEANPEKTKYMLLSRHQNAE